MMWLVGSGANVSSEFSLRLLITGKLKLEL
jgi:hypothetical protein